MSGVKGALGDVGGGLKSAGGGIARTLGPVGQGLGKMSAEFGRMFHPLIRRSGVVVIVLSVLVVAAGIGYLLLWNSDQDHDDEVTARKEAAETAKVSVSRMFSYQYDTIDQELASVESLLTGAFKDEYSNLVRTQLSPLAKQQKANTKTDVVGDSVISGDADEVKMLLFLNQVATSPMIEQPINTGSSVRVTLEKEDGDWLISALEPI